jgi:hypothetical protein
MKAQQDFIYHRRLWRILYWYYSIRRPLIWLNWGSICFINENCRLKHNLTDQKTTIIRDRAYKKKTDSPKMSTVKNPTFTFDLAQIQVVSFQCNHLFHYNHKDIKYGLTIINMVELRVNILYKWELQVKTQLNWPENDHN